MGCTSGKCVSTTRLDGKTAIVTGSSSGIGQFTAFDLYTRGCRVIMACLPNEGDKAMNQILEKSKNFANVGELILESIDLASMQSIHCFASKLLKTEPRIDILINNAGVLMCSKEFTVDGFELEFGTNYLGHFLLTMLLLPRIMNSTPGRIVNVASIAHRYAREIDWGNLNAEKSYEPIRNYATSKLAIILITRELARRLEGKNVNVYSLHPGEVSTHFTRNLPKMFFPHVDWLWRNMCGCILKTVEQGAQTTIYCAVDDGVAHESGLYYADCKHARLSTQAQDMEKAKKLWDVSLKLVKLDGYDPFVITDTPPIHMLRN